MPFQKNLSLPLSWSVTEADERTCRDSNALGLQSCLLRLFRGPPRAVPLIVGDLCHCTHDSSFSCATKPPFLPSYVSFNSRDSRTPFLLKQDKIYHLFKDFTAFMQEFFERTTLYLLPTCTLPVPLFQHDLLAFLCRLIDYYYPKYLCLWRPLAVIMKWQLKSCSLASILDG